MGFSIIIMRGTLNNVKFTIWFITYKWLGLFDSKGFANFKTSLHTCSFAQNILCGPFNNDIKLGVGMWNHKCFNLKWYNKGLEWLPVLDNRCWSQKYISIDNDLYFKQKCNKTVCIVTIANWSLKWDKHLILTHVLS